MSYYKCKGMVIKKDSLVCDIASSNITPITYSKCEMSGKSIEQKMFNLFTDLMSGNIHIDNLNNSTIKYEYALTKVREYLQENNIDSYECLYCKQYDIYNKEISDELGFDITSDFYDNEELKEKYNTFMNENKELLEQLRFKSRYAIYKDIYNLFKEYLAEEEPKGEYILYSNNYGYIKPKGKNGAFYYNSYRVLEKGNYKKMYCKMNLLDFKNKNIEIKRYLMNDTDIQKELELKEEDEKQKELAKEKIKDLEQVKKDIVAYQNGSKLDRYYFESICKLCNIECKIPKNVYEISYNSYSSHGHNRRNRKIENIFYNTRKELKNYNVESL